ncbi:MAG: hypothetical protein JXO22_17815 [Phycisphaerae bacterium]|nr:hypothetical protein [Phycisphaerae bacterium]
MNRYKLGMVLRGSAWGASIGMAAGLLAAIGARDYWLTASMVCVDSVMLGTFFGFWTGCIVANRRERAQRLRRSLAAQGRCERCGYDLTGNVSGRCPECGEPIQNGPPAIRS